MTMTITPVWNTTAKRETISLQVDWTSDASGDASLDTDNYTHMGFRITDFIKGKYVVHCQTKPGTTPTASYDIVINDTNSEDIFGGNLANRSNSVAETVFPGTGSVYGSIPITGHLTFVVSNAGNAKTGSIILHLE